MKTISLIGDSHLRALQEASAPFQEQQGFIWKFCVVFDPPYKPPFSEVSGRTELNPHLIKAIQVADALVCSIGGNHHCAMGLIDHPEAFDFDSRELPELPLDSNRFIVPYSEIRAQLEYALGKSVLPRMLKIREVADIEVFHIESPPPSPEKQILEYPASFADLLKTHTVAPLYLRRKLWKLHSAIMREFCEQNEISFLPVPSETLAEDGSLRKDLANTDPTHGNTKYGSILLEHFRTNFREHFSFNG
jgi:hypothetical protein